MNFVTEALGFLEEHALVIVAAATLLGTLVRFTPTKADDRFVTRVARALLVVPALREIGRAILSAVGGGSDDEPDDGGDAGP